MSGRDMKSLHEPLIRGQHLYPPDVINRHFCEYLLFIKHMHLPLFASSMWVESVFISAREPACALIYAFTFPLWKLKSIKSDMSNPAVLIFSPMCAGT